MKKIKIDLKHQQIQCLISHCAEICDFDTDRDDWDMKLCKIMLYELICDLQKKVIGAIKPSYKVTIKPPHGFAFLALTELVNINNEDYHSFMINTVYNTLHQKLL